MPKPPAPQSLYTGSALPRLDPKGKKLKPPEPEIPYGGYVRLVRRLSRMFGPAKGARFGEDTQSAIDFLGIDVAPADVYGAKQGLLSTSIIIGIVLGALVGFSLGAFSEDGLATGLVLAPFGIIAVIALVGFGLGYYVVHFAEMEADKEKKLAVAYIPEIVNYLVMNMRLSPNLEKSVEFAANHGRGKIAQDFKKLIWDSQLGVYSSVEEGLDAMAYRWGPYNDDFKQALMLIRASVLEGDEARRIELLDKASNDVIEGSKEKMDLYARQLHQPTVYLYYFGILLPLMLAIVLPIGSGMLKDLPLPGIMLFIGIYNIFIPLVIYVMAKGIIAGRPPTYVPPDIPEDFEGLPPKGYFRFQGALLPYVPLGLMVMAACVVAGYLIDAGTVAVKMADITTLEPQKAVDAIPHITIPLVEFRIYQFMLLGILIGGSLAISTYFYGKYSARKRVQDEIRAMEQEFKDALYVLASRLGENRPIEDALKHAIEFLPKSLVAARVFRRILDNISTMGMTLENAIFDPTFGAVRDVPSEIIRSGMRVMTDSVQLGVNVAANSLINLSMQIRNQQKIDDMLRRLLEDVTVMLSTMGTFIAPIVLAVVTSLQKVIINSLVGGCPDTSAATSASVAGAPSIGSTGAAGMFCGIKNPVGPGEFTFVMGIYVIEVVILLTYFNSQIEDTNNRLHAYVSVSKALPVAIIIFSAVSIIAGLGLGGSGG